MTATPQALKGNWFRGWNRLGLSARILIGLALGVLFVGFHERLGGFFQSLHPFCQFLQELLLLGHAISPCLGACLGLCSR
jgi:hypothetical protein